jgi:hypothetical protein
MCLYDMNTNTCSYSVSQITAMEQRETKFSFHAITIFFIVHYKQKMFIIRLN